MRNNAIILMVCMGVLLSLPKFSSAQWIETNGPGTNLIFSLAFKGEDLFVGAYQAGVFRSSDNGENWAEANSGLGDLNIWSLAIMGSNLFAGTDGGVFLSTNNGASWTEVNSGLMLEYGYSSFAVNGASLFVGSPIGGIFRSENSGTSWIDVTTIDIDDFLIKALSASGGTVFAGTYAGRVYRSDNNGTSWTSVNSGMPQTTINAFIINNSTVFAGTDTGLFISTNNGTSWTGPNSGLPAETRVRSFAKNGTTVYAGTKNGVFLSADNGTSWSAVNSGLTDTNVTALAASGTNLFAGTFGGMVWRLPLGGASTKKRQNQPGERTSLKLTSPCREGYTVTIGFSLPRSELVTVKIIDVSGREIATLINGRLGAGTHRVSWDTRKLSAGLYAVCMQTGMKIQTKSIPLFR